MYDATPSYVIMDVVYLTCGVIAPTEIHYDYHKSVCHFCCNQS